MTDAEEVAVWNAAIEAAADYMAGLDNPYMEGGDTHGYAGMIRTLKRESPPQKERS